MFALIWTTFANDGKTQSKRPSFARRKATFCRLKGGILEGRWLSGSYTEVCRRCGKRLI